MAGVPVPAAAVDPAQIDAALERLEAGQLVAFPTETVYGLGGDARNPAAIEAIFELKGRPRSHPVIVHVAPGTGLRAWAREIPAAAEVLIERFWPGPLTLVLLRASGVADALTGGQDTVALRCPAHPVALALLAGLAARHPGAGVAAPSANRFGRISPTRAEHVRDEFGSALMVLDGGPAQVGIESTILDLSRLSTLGPVLLRPGAIGAAELAEVLGCPLCAAGAAPSGRSQRTATGPGERWRLVLFGHGAAGPQRLAACSFRPPALCARTLCNAAWVRSPGRQCDLDRGATRGSRVGCDCRAGGAADPGNALGA